MIAQDALARPFTAKLTVADFFLLDRSGAFDAYSKTELIDGTVVAVNAQFGEHFTVKTKLLRRLADACDTLDGGLQAWSEGSIAIPPHNVPEPDLFITSLEPVTGAVDVATVALVAEITSTSHKDDLGPMLRIYAEAGIPEYWVVDVKAQVIHQMWSPDGATYAARREAPFGQPLTAAAIPGLTIATTAL